MRFKKGSKVEILCKKDAPSGSWRCAEIICGNGYNYTVKYGGYAGTTGDISLEQISRNAIRPCPPLPEAAENWVPGDVVEVFDDFSWKMATISKVLGKKYFLVRLLGSFLEFEVSKSHIRTRLLWQDDKWIVIRKGSRICEDGKRDENLTLKYGGNSMSHVHLTNTRRHSLEKDDLFPVRNQEKFNKSYIASSRTLKRRSYDHFQVEAYDGVARKFRAIEKEGRLHRVITANQSALPKQVDAFPREMLGAKFVHSSLNNRTRFSVMDVERRNQSGAVGCSCAVDLEPNDTDSVTCSVGSCSITGNNSYKFNCHARFIGDIGGDSDAESFCKQGYEEGYDLLPAKEELAAEIHRLELHAYRCTMEALHALGPLSWEQEALVTNLRLSLHISNDEHLMEGQSRRLVHLISKC